MAVGDVVAGISTVNSGSYLDIRPPSGQEWVIHNIYHEDSIELSFYDGTNEVIFDGDPGAGFYAWYEFHCTNTYRIRVKNLGASAQKIGYDGIQTK